MNGDELIPTRWSLISRLKDWHDEESWRVFHDTYGNLISSVALRAGLTRDEADEVLQETLLVVAKKVRELKTNSAAGSFKGWLLQTTRWRIADQFRKRGKPDSPHRRQSVSPNDDSDRTDTIGRIVDANGQPLESFWEEEWKANLLKSALVRLKEKAKPEYLQVFDLAVVRRWPVSKVAAALGINIGQVYLAKHRVAGLIRREVARLNSELI